MVDIYLDFNDSDPLLFLSIPSSDVQRLSYRPLKWLRYVAFTICGARGNLLRSHHGTVVDYHTAIHDIANTYYYHPTEPYAFIDYNAFNDQVTSSTETTQMTPRQQDFRDNIIERDGPLCIISEMPAEDCHGCHIIPRSKGDEYIRAVTQRRGSRYNPPHPEICLINATENGLLLTKSLDSMFTRGAVAFLKTPNFALNPEDVPRVEDGPMPSRRTTLQYLEPPPTGRCQIPALDAVFGTLEPRDENAPPPAILLDFMYGAAAYKRWGTGSEMRRVIHDKFVEEYQSIPVLQKPPRKPNIVLPRSSDPQAPLIDAMDAMNAFMMYVSGATPEMRTAEWRKEEEERQSKNEAVSRSKVLEWMKDNAK